MAAEEGIASSIAAMQVQAIFIDCLIQEAADFEFAFQMQLQEALRVSQLPGIGKGKQPIEHAATHEEEQQSSTNEQNVTGDRQASMTKQKEELQNLQQEMDDALVAMKEEERFRQLDAVTQHDAHFARFLSECGDRSNMCLKSLDQLSDPFTIPPADGDIAEKGQGRSRGIRRGLNLEGASTSVHCRGDVWQPALAVAYFVDPPPRKMYRSSVTINDGVEEDHDTEKGSFGALGEGSTSLCTICMDTVMSPSNSIVVSDNCKHEFCKACLQKHGETSIRSGQTYITCPAVACEVLWSAKLMSDMLSIDSQLVLEQRQLEEAVPPAERVYCPYPDCSILQMKPDVENQGSTSYGPAAAARDGAECCFCNRFFCLECLVPWHSNMSCEDFQNLPADERTTEDLSLKELASSRKWQRCTQCGFVVELNQGCNHITCWCGYQFCYTCGGAWAHGHLCHE